MSNVIHSTEAQEANFGKLAPVAGLVALVGALLMIVGYITDAPTAMGSYMFGYTFWLTLTLGCFGFTLVHHMLRGSWGVAILRPLEAGGGAGMLAAFALLFLPIAFSMHAIYPWTHEGGEVIARKAWWLNEPFFLVRAALYFIFWIWLASRLRRSTVRQDETKDFALESKRGSWGAAGFLAFFITGSFAFIDWVMSMEPHWFSSMYPVWILVASGLAAVALVTMIVCVSADKEPFRSVVSPYLTRDLGNLLFTLTMLWGYTAISQYLIIWNGNIPEFTQYFIHRQGNWWNGIGAAIIVGQFIVPFASLLASRTKSKPIRLARVAGWIFAVHILDVYQTVVPAVPASARPHDARWIYSPMPIWTDFVAFLTIGAVWVLVFALQSRKAPLVPTYDTRLQEAIAHAH
jgi:hypothetical protein